MPHGLKLARGSWKHHDRRLSRHHQTRRGTHRIDHLRTSRDHRLLLIGGQYRVEVAGVETRVARHQPLEDVGDRVFQFRVQYQLASTETGDHLDGHVIGRRS
ncbi:hypothetical protein A3649_13655 [Mycobacterium ulcerans]|nr:hypothetical protein A3649_13655 [Mycobacterium ulcerans]